MRSEDAEAFYAPLVGHARDKEGSCTGEQGIAVQKRKFTADETGGSGIDAMHAIKCAPDPKGLLNPGKKLPAP